MPLIRRSGTILVLLLTSSLLLNACSGKSQARTPGSTGATTAGATTATKSAAQPAAESNCDALDKASFEVEAGLMGVGMGTEMGSSRMIASDIERTQTAIAKVAALQPQDPKVKALQAQYLTLAKAALQPVEPLAKAGNDSGLKAVAADVKAKIKAADEFRKEQIFFGDCKK
jgi:hypothetical protein